MLERKIQSIPHCVGEMDTLRILLIDRVPSLTNVPISILSLPEVVLLSVTNSDVDYQDILRYNLPEDIDTNDIVLVNQWMDSNFKYNNANDTEYWWSYSAICEQNLSNVSVSLLEFLEISCQYPIEVEGTINFEGTCAPYMIGDGYCDLECKIAQLLYDDGDCS